MIKIRVDTILILSALLLALGGCGVKGDPVQPVTPVEIGSGRPQIKMGRDAPGSISPPMTDPDEPKEDDVEE